MADVTGSGFDFSIEVTGNYETRLDTFVSKLEAARAAVTSFKTDMAGIATRFKEASTGLSSTAQASSEAASSIKKSSAATRDASKELSIQEKAAKNVEAAILKKMISEEEAAIIEREQIRVLQQATKYTKEETEAFKQLETEQSKQRIEALKQQEANKQGVETSKQKATRLREEATAEKERQKVLASAVREKDKADDKRNRDQLRYEARKLREDAAALKEKANQTDNLTQAIDRIDRAQNRAIQNNLQGQLGFDAQGKPLGEIQAPPSPFGQEQGPELSRAQEILVASRKRLEAERELAEIHGRNAQGLSAQEQIERNVAAILERRQVIDGTILALQDQGLDKDGKKIANLTVQERIQKNIAAILDKQAVQEGTRSALKERGLDPRGAPLAAALSPQQQAEAAAATRLQSLELQVLQKRVQDANPRFRELQKELGATASIGNRVAFTFRRLFGIFAAFTAVRLFVAQLRDAVLGSIEFNSQMEQSVLGISALILATGKIEDTFGRATTATESFGLAQREARRQVELLRKENLRTPATLPELLRAFQSSVGPGLSSGLPLDQIRKFSVSVSKAAGTIGLPQDQLPEEIRSLLQGTISSRNTRIATALGITNEDIRRAKELGNLAGFLETKFAAFERVSEEGLNTFNVQLTNAKDNIQALLASGFESFFNKLKDVLRFVNDTLVTVGDKVVINPRALAAVEQLGSVLSFAVDEAKRLLTAFSADDAVSSFQTIAYVLKGIIALVGIFIEGLLKGLALVARPLSVLVGAIESLLGTFGLEARTVLVTLLSWLVAFKSISFLMSGLPAYAAQLGVQVLKAALASKGMEVSLLSMVGTGTNLKGVFAAIAGLAGTAAGRLGLVAAIVTGLLVGYSAIKEKQEEVFGAQLSWLQSLRVSGYQLGLIAVAFAETWIDSFQSVLNQGIITFGTLALFVADKLGGAVRAVLSSLPEFVPGISKSLLALDAGLASIRGGLASAINKAAEESAKGGGFFERTLDRLRQTNDEAATFAQQLTAGTAEGVDLVKAIEDMPSIVGNTTREMDSLVKSAESLKNELEAAQESFAVALKTRGSDGAVQQQARAIAEANTRLLKEQSSVQSQITSAKADSSRLDRESLEIGERVNSLSDKDLNTYNQVLSSTRQILDLQHQIAESKDAGTSFKTEDLTKRLEAAKKVASGVFDGISPDKQKTIFALAESFLVNQGAQVDAQRRVTEASREYGKLRSQIFAVAEAKIGEIGLKEYEEGQKRLREADLQLQAAQKLAAARGSRTQSDEQSATSDNDIARQRLELTLLQEKNKRQQESLRWIAAQFKGTQLGAALNAQLLQQTAEQTKQEQTLAATIEGSANAAALAVTLRAEAHDSVVASMQAETREARLQLELQRGLLVARRTRTTFDDQTVQSQSDISLQRSRIEELTRTATREESIKVSEIRTTTDATTRNQLEAELVALREKNLISLASQKALLALMIADSKELIRNERERQAGVVLDTEVSRQQFDAGLGTDVRREQFVQLTSNVLLEQQKLSYIDQGTVEYQQQNEQLRQASVLLQRFIAQQNAPVREGLFEGMRQFIREAPSSFDISVGLMKQSLEGLAQVGADSITAIFDPRNTTSFRERLGELALSIGNSIFKGLFDQLISSALQGVFPQLAQGAGLSAAAGQLTTAGALWQGVATQLIVAANLLTAAGAVQGASGILGAAGGLGGTAGTSLFGFPGSHGGRVTPSGIVPGFAKGGPNRDPRDTIPAMLRRGEYVLTPEAVERVGLGFVEDLNSLRTPPALQGIAAIQSSGSLSRPSIRSSSSVSPQSQTQGQGLPSTVRAWMIPNEDTAEMILAGGGGAFDRWLASRGYRPATA